MFDAGRQVFAQGRDEVGVEPPADVAPAVACSADQIDVVLRALSEHARFDGEARGVEGLTGEQEGEDSALRDGVGQERRGLV